MEMLDCQNCGKRTGHKRTLGFGTFFAVLITFGLWILTIPFYPKRCIICGERRSVNSWNSLTPTQKKAWGIIALIAIFAVILSQLVPSTNRPSVPEAVETSSSIGGETPGLQPDIPPSVKWQEPDVAVSAEQLMTDRQTGGAEKADKYVNKIIAVTGVVDNTGTRNGAVSMNATGVCEVHDSNYIMFWFNKGNLPQLSRIHPGQTVTIEGRFASSGKNPMPKGFDIPGCGYYIDIQDCTLQDQHSEQNASESSNKLAEDSNHVDRSSTSPGAVETPSSEE